MNQHQPRRPDAMVTDSTRGCAAADPQGRGRSPLRSGDVLLDYMQDLPSGGPVRQSLALRSLSAGDRLAGRKATGWTTSAASARQARESREYVRRLLREKQPEFAAALEVVKRELCQGFHADL